MKPGCHVSRAEPSTSRRRPESRRARRRARTRPRSRGIGAHRVTALRRCGARSPTARRIAGPTFPRACRRGPGCQLRMPTCTGSGRRAPSSRVRTRCAPGQSAQLRQRRTDRQSARNDARLPRPAQAPRPAAQHIREKRSHIVRPLGPPRRPTRTASKWGCDIEFHPNVEPQPPHLTMNLDRNAQPRTGPRMRTPNPEPIRIPLDRCLQWGVG